MQPVRRYNLDAAILFSDILVVLQALDIEVTMPGGIGITVPNPLLHPTDVATRIPKSVNIREKLSHVLEAIRLIKRELNGKIPLIGFSAAPWSLFFYLLGGSTKKNQTIASEWLHNYPDESKTLFELLTNIVIEYLSLQIEAGVELIQVFEAMGQYITEDDFNVWCLPSLKKISFELKKKYPAIPLLIFPRGAQYAVFDLQQAGYDVVCLDSSVDRLDIRNLLQKNAVEKTPPRGFVSSIQGF
jgi:uroporphyrinogen decarboxylase